MASPVEQGPLDLTSLQMPNHKSKKDVPGHFPDPLVIPPSLKHQQTFIILHGRGSTAAKFAPPLLETLTTSGETIQTAFPHAKLIFLAASLNRAKIYKNSYTHQWFDNWHMEEFGKRQDLAREGLNKSCKYVHGILRKEIALIGEKNVVLWGLSQGCATSLTSLLTWDGTPFAATVGMCGYLPFSNFIKEIAEVKGSQDEDDDDIFGNDNKPKDPATEAITFLRDEIDLNDKHGMLFQNIPVFMGHGNQDDKVPIEIGREAAKCLDLVGANVKTIEYEGLGHWYSPQMLKDIFEFLRQNLSTQSGILGHSSLNI